MANFPTGTGGSAKLQIYADAQHVDDFTSFYKALGMSQREAGSRLFDWFNSQSQLIRQHILQPMPEEVAPDIARIILERMAEQDRLRQTDASTATEPEAELSAGRQQQQPQRLTVYGAKKPSKDSTKH